VIKKKTLISIEYLSCITAHQGNYEQNKLKNYFQKIKVKSMLII